MIQVGEISYFLYKTGSKSHKTFFIAAHLHNWLSNLNLRSTVQKIEAVVFIQKKCLFE